jgi:hypothetical protein
METTTKQRKPRTLKPQPKVILDVKAAIKEVLKTNRELVRINELSPPTRSGALKVMDAADNTLASWNKLISAAQAGVEVAQAKIAAARELAFK